ncbi:hypothetical protein LR004_03255, partial [Candidatus Gracilibacteria bacterium]|nr:hypothetical protein [Candidatus Gracilibacteria bacterium]
MSDGNNSSNSGVNFHVENEDGEGVHIDVSSLKNGTLKKVLHILENEDMYFLENTENRTEPEEKNILENINN